MYSAVHSAAGIGLTVAGHSLAGPTGAVAGAILGVLSHDPLDRLGEAAYGASWPPSRATLMWEGFPLLALTIGAYLAGPQWWLLALDWVAGNLMDLVDKSLWLIGKSPIFPAHHRAPNVQLTGAQTKGLAVCAALFFIAAGLVV